MSTETQNKLVTTRKPKSPARKDNVGRRVFESIGRNAMLDTLTAAQDPRAQHLLELMMDPQYRNFTFPKLCERSGLSVTQVLDLFRKYKLDLGMIEMSKQVPRIMRDVARDAQSTMAYCRRCDGTGEVPDGDTERVCPACKGAGEVRITGNEKARQLVFEAFHLTGKRGGPLVAQQFNLKQDRKGTETLEDLITVAEKAAKG